MSSYTLIGDMVGSRRAPDRRGLQIGLHEALRVAGEGVVTGPMPLQATIGDEFQGTFKSLSDLLGASLIARLELLRLCDTDCRIGLGYGGVERLDPSSPNAQDGPGWWSAREAIERVSEFESVPSTAFSRSFFIVGAESRGVSRDEAAAVNAYLVCRDAIIDRMNAHSRRRLLWLLQDRPQSAIADSEGVTQGSVSVNLSRSGAFAIRAAQLMFTEPNH